MPGPDGIQAPRHIALLAGKVNCRLPKEVGFCFNRGHLGQLFHLQVGKVAETEQFRAGNQRVCQDQAKSTAHVGDLYWAKSPFALYHLCT